MNQCEKIDLSGKAPTWTTLPSMKEASRCFNPCLFQGCIYVCGGDSQLIEAFSLRSDSFLPQQLHLPDTCLGCCLYVSNQLLVVHSKRYILKYARTLTGLLAQSSQVEGRNCVSKWSNSQPVLVRGLFFLFQGDKCLCFNADTGALVQGFL